MMLTVKFPPAQLRWVLSGPSGLALDTIVAALIGAGAGVECIKASTRYRITGPAPLLGPLAESLAAVEGFALTHEVAPADTINVRSTLEPLSPPRRSVTLHGTGSTASAVRAAIDRGFLVAPVGIERYDIRAARTADLIGWLSADVFLSTKTPGDVMTLFGLNAAQVAREDEQASSPVVQVAVVAMPDRRTTSDITHDAAGRITHVVQTETTP